LNLNEDIFLGGERLSHVRRELVVTERLNNQGFEVDEGELDGSASRFVTAWNTNPTDVDQLLAVVAEQ
jgi:threonine aldolase